METSLVSDRLSNALSLPLVWQFFIEIWTTSVSHPPPQTRIWPGSDVSSPLPNIHCHPNTWWKWAQLLTGFLVRYRLLRYDRFSLRSEPRLYPTPPLISHRPRYDRIVTSSTLTSLMLLDTQKLDGNAPSWLCSFQRTIRCNTMSVFHSSAWAYAKMVVDIN